MMACTGVYLFFAVLFTTVAVGSSDAVGSGDATACFTKEVDTAYGNNYRIVDNVAHWKACAANCNQESRCKAFSYYSADFKIPVVQLKCHLQDIGFESTKSTGENVKGIISGVPVNCTDLCFTREADSQYGKTYTSTVAADAAECATKCAMNFTNCWAYTYYTNGRCDLSDSTFASTRRLLPGAVSGTHTTQSACPWNATAVPGSDVVAISCKHSTMSATIDPSKLMNSTIVSIYVEGCDQGTGYNVTGYIVTASFENCAHNVSQDDNVIIHESRLILTVGQNDSTHAIERGSQLTYTMQCLLDRRINVFSSLGVNVTDKKSVFVKKAETNFTAQMMFYSNNLFDTPAATPLEVASSEPLYISVYALQGQSMFKFIVEDCYATPSADPLDTKRYLFFSDKCPIDQTFQTYEGLSYANKFCFKIDAFRFIMIKAKVFFHCRLLICQKSSNSTECTQRCPLGRRRRAIENGGVDEFYVNSGAVVFKRKPTCADTTCPLNGLCYNLRPAVCRCRDGFVHDVTSKTCKSTDNRVFKATNFHLKKQFLPSFGEPTSDEFIRLATHIEGKLLTAYLIDRDVVKGVKVVGAREGSIVLDVLVLYSDAMTSREAFDYFVARVVEKETSDTQTLSIKRYINPRLELISDGGGKIRTGRLAMIIAVPSVSVALIVVVAAVVLRRRHETEKVEVKAQDNQAVSMDNVS